MTELFACARCNTYTPDSPRQSVLSWLHPAHLLLCELLSCAAAAVPPPCQGVICVLLNGSLDLSVLPRIPVRPTHSRHNSFSDLGAEVAASLAAGGGLLSAPGTVGGASGPPSSSGASQPGSPLVGFPSLQVRLLLLLLLLGVCGASAGWGKGELLFSTAIAVPSVVGGSGSG